LSCRPHGHQSQRSRLGYAQQRRLANLAAAEQAGFDVFITADKNIRHQQNLSGRRIALVVLSTPQWPVVKLNLDQHEGNEANATEQLVNRLQADSQSIHDNAESIISLLAELCGCVSAVFKS
jgi:hypothetical protein